MTFFPFPYERDYISLTRGAVALRYSLSTVGARVDHPGMTQGNISKTGMGYKGTRDDLMRAQRCTHGVY